MEKKILVIDSGSSFMKAIYNKGSAIYHEHSLVARLLENTKLKERIRCLGDDGLEAWYVAGKKARIQLTDLHEEADIRADFHGSNRQRTQIMYAMEKLGVADLDLLVITVPYSMYFDDDPVLKKMAGNKNYEWKNSDGIEKKVSVKDVILIPQGTPAQKFYEYKFGQLPDEVISVDIGSSTTDVISLIKDHDTGEYEYREAQCKSFKDKCCINHFVSMIIERIQTKMHGKLNVDFLSIVDKINRKEFTLQFESQIINFEKEYLKVKEDFTEIISEILTNELGKTWISAEKILLNGGGERFIVEHKWNCKNRTVRLGIFANLIGSLFIAEEYLGLPVSKHLLDNIEIDVRKIYGASLLSEKESVVTI